MMETEFGNSFVKELCFLKSPERFDVGASLNTPDESTFYGGDDRGYIDYPFLEEG